MDQPPNNAPLVAPPSLTQAIFVAMVAGIGTALMSGMLTPGLAPAVFLSLIAPAPLFIAGFGWHPLVAALGGIIAGLSVNLFVGTPAALVIFGVFGVPAYVLTQAAEVRFSNYAGRPDRDGIDLGRLAVMLILYVAVAGTIAVLMIEPDFEALQARIRRSMQAAFSVIGAGSRSPGVAQPDPTAIIDMLAGVMLPLSALVMTTTIIVGATMGLAVADRSGRLPYVRPDMRRFRLPGGALILAGIAFIVALRDGYTGLLGEIVALGLCLGFMLQGLAVTHVRTIGIGGRGFVLASIWAALVVFGIPALIFIIIGMIDHLFDFRRGRL